MCNQRNQWSRRLQGTFENISENIRERADHIRERATAVVTQSASIATNNRYKGFASDGSDTKGNTEGYKSKGDTVITEESTPSVRVTFPRTGTTLQDRV